MIEEKEKCVRLFLFLSRYISPLSCFSYRPFNVYVGAYVRYLFLVLVICPEMRKRRRFYVFQNARPRIRLGKPCRPSPFRELRGLTAAVHHDRGSTG